MPVKAEALGAELEARTVDVTTRMILAYSAGIGETGDRTFNDASDQLVASRAFCVALEWPVISGRNRQTLLGLRDDELLRGVHVELDSQFHRLIRPGDRLRTTGAINAIRATAAGAFVQYRLITTIASDDGAPVTTTWYGAIFRGIEVDGVGGVVEECPPCPAATGAFDHCISIPIAPEAPHVYTECSGIWNPIHTERRVALAAGLPNVILHGTATWALAGRELVRHYGSGDPGRLLRLRARFKAPVIPGSAITVSHALSDGKVHFDVTRSDGQYAVLGGYAEFVHSSCPPPLH